MPTLKKAALVAAAALALPGVGLAEDPQVPISANLTFTSDYVFRGISQTDEKFAVQGGFDWESANYGIYIGTWASNISWTDDEASSAEVDVYFGWKKNWNDWGLDIGYIHFNYPGFSIGNSDEVYATGSWKWIYLSYYRIVSTGYFGVQDARGSEYGQIGADYTFPAGFTIGASYGATRLSGDDPSIAGANSLADYDDYKVYVGYSDTTYTGLDFELAWTDTDIDNPADIAKDRVYFSITKNF